MLYIQIILIISIILTIHMWRPILFTIYIGCKLFEDCILKVLGIYWHLNCIKKHDKETIVMWYKLTCDFFQISYII